MRTSYFIRASAAILGILLLSGGPAMAGDAAKSARADGLRHSGTIVAIDEGARAITIDEMGPWHGEGTGLKRVTLRLRPDMKVMLVERASEASTEGYATSPLSLSDLRVGDFVTLKAERLGDGGGVGVALEVVRPSGTDEGRTVVPAASPLYERAWPEAPSNMK